MVRTTSVGSWPPPFGQRPALRPLWWGQRNEEDPEIARALVDAARVAMDEMLACGLDQITGGEVFAPDFVHTVPPRLTGLEAERVRDMRLGQAGVARYRVTGPVTAPRGLGYARAFERERAIEPTLDKATVPSPYTIALPLHPSDVSPAVLDQLVAIVSDEVAALAAAGATDIQLDAPAEAIACVDMTADRRMLTGLIAAPFEGVDRSVRRSVHFCLGDIDRKPSTVFQNLRYTIQLVQSLEGAIDRALLECSYEGQWQDRDLLVDIPSSIEVVAGLGDVKRRPDDRTVYKRQIEDLLGFVPAERLIVSTSCGCGRMPHDDAIRLNLELARAALAVDG
ncbi:MAG: hypothetical protein ACFCVK_03765 [Acidimicrobiales bacterium]